MSKPFQPNKPLTTSSIARLIQVFLYREGDTCPAAKEAERILDSDIGRNSADLQALIIEQLHELEETHRVFDGTKVDYRSRAGKEKG